MLGVIKQTTGSTDAGYFALGGMLVISGLIMLSLPKKSTVGTLAADAAEVKE
ncbi:hypothetical protein HMPREF0080_00816 [Anaeroglobus geminatus F0357]|uniref:Major facilitator superfamily (MFS) profile domain-containing protein n=2 Tax=Anaeroglobus TaxID=156454 RepID=G9YGP9_9FIRM|nr:hypothetical protein HMPREF0080_00816 [Anaeroglobus geminatus F0357]